MVGMLAAVTTVFSAAVAIVALLLAQETNGEIPYFSGIVVGISVIGILTLFWNVQRSTVRPLQRDLERCRADSRRAQWQLRELERSLRAHGITPPNIWGKPPWMNDEEWQELEEESSA